MAQRPVGGEPDDIDAEIYPPRDPMQVAAMYAHG